MTNSNDYIYPVYFVTRRKFYDEYGHEQRWEIDEQDVVAFAASRSFGEAHAHTLNEQHADHLNGTDDRGDYNKYFTVGHGRHAIVSLPKSIRLVT